MPNDQNLLTGFQRIALSVMADTPAKDVANTLKAIHAMRTWAILSAIFVAAGAPVAAKSSTVFVVYYIALMLALVFSIWLLGPLYRVFQLRNEGNPVIAEFVEFYTMVKKRYPKWYQDNL